MKAIFIKAKNHKTIKLNDEKTGKAFGNVTEITSKKVGAKKANKATVLLEGNDYVHYHKEAEEQYTCIWGSGIIFIDGEVLEFNRGETVIIPPGTRHAAGPRSSSHSIFFACISSPPYDSRDEYKEEPFRNWGIEKPVLDDEQK